jgi:hypothetical protein
LAQRFFIPRCRSRRAWQATFILRNNTQSPGLWLPRALLPKTHHRIGTGTHLTPLPCPLLFEPLLRRVAAPLTARDLVHLLLPSRPSARFPLSPDPKFQQSLRCASPPHPTAAAAAPVLALAAESSAEAVERTTKVDSTWLAVDSNEQKSKGAVRREGPLPPLRSTQPARPGWLYTFGPAQLRVCVLIGSALAVPGPTSSGGIDPVLYSLRW